MNLGLLPSSEECWPVACGALKAATGGWLHIHCNVATKSAQNAENQTLQIDDENYDCLLKSPSLRCADVRKWIKYVSTRIQILLRDTNPLHCAGSVCKEWEVMVGHVEHVKQYAPRVSHLVLDLECRPVKQSHSENI